MSMDSVHNVKAILALTPAALTSFGAGAAIDTAGFQALTFVIPVGAFATFTGTDKLTLKVQESDTTTTAISPISPPPTTSAPTRKGPAAGTRFWTAPTMTPPALPLACG